MEHCDGHHPQVEKMDHHSDITINRLSLLTNIASWQKDRIKTFQGGCQKTTVQQL